MAKITTDNNAKLTMTCFAVPARRIVAPGRVSFLSGAIHALRPSDLNGDSEAVPTPPYPLASPEAQSSRTTGSLSGCSSTTGAPATPTCWRTFSEISIMSSRFSARKTFAFSRPWPICSPS